MVQYRVRPYKKENDMHKHTPKEYSDCAKWEKESPQKIQSDSPKEDNRKVPAKKREKQRSLGETNE